MAQQRKLRPINARRGQPAQAYRLPEGEYWIESAQGSPMVKLTVSHGPHGLGIRLDSFVCTEPLSIMSPLETQRNERHLELCQYQPNETAQAFKRWYLEQETEEDMALLGAEYLRGLKV